MELGEATGGGERPKEKENPNSKRDTRAAAMEAPELADVLREDAERTAAKERRAGAAATTIGAGTADCDYLVFAEGAEAARLCHPFANVGSVVLHDVAMAGNAVHPTATDRAYVKSKT